MIAFLAGLAGLAVYILRVSQPAFFKGKTLTRATPTLVPDE